MWWQQYISQFFEKLQQTKKKRDLFSILAVAKKYEEVDDEHRAKPSKEIFFFFCVATIPTFYTEVYLSKRIWFWLSLNTNPTVSPVQ